MPMETITVWEIGQRTLVVSRADDAVQWRARELGSGRFGISKMSRGSSQAF